MGFHSLVQFVDEDTEEIDGKICEKINMKYFFTNKF